MQKNEKKKKDDVFIMCTVYTTVSVLRQTVNAKQRAKRRKKHASKKFVRTLIFVCVVLGCAVHVHYVCNIIL